MIMLKRLFLAILLLAPVQAALAYGTIGFSLSQNLDQFGKPLAGCKFYTYQAGTVATPQSAYSDTGLTVPLPNPQTCDSAGRLPQFFLADGSIKITLTTSSGTPVITADNILVIGPSSGGGGGGTVDPTTVLATGDMKARYGTGALTGFVRANGRTIGNAVSGASERANADTQALFVYLYTTDTNLVVSPGRTGNALNDFNANMTIALPDWRGRALAFLDDMGSSAAGRLTATYFGTAATVLGATGGAESRTLSLAQLPTGITSGNASQSITVNTSGGGNIPTNTGGWSLFSASIGSGINATQSNLAITNITSLTGNNSISVTSNNTSGAALATASPMMLATIYIKM